MRKFLMSAALALGLIAPAFSHAEDPAVNTGKLSISGGVDYVTAYYFRGYNLGEGQLIVQPYATLTAKLLESDNVSINANLGSWASLQGHHGANATTGTHLAEGDSIFYEQDYYAWLDFIFGKFVVSTAYNIYTYPGNGAADSTEVTAKVAYDDADMMKGMNVPFALKPYVLYAYGLSGTDEYQYLELGISPSFSAPGNVTVTVPINVGGSLDGYYIDSDGHNSNFGFWSIGVVGSVPLPIPAKYGTWSASAGITYIDLLADSSQLANDDNDEYEFVGKVSIAFTY